METRIDSTHVSQRIEQIWLLVREARVREAKGASEVLFQQLQRQCEERPNERDGLQALVHASHIAGYTAALRTRGNDALVPASYFGAMERVARDLQDEVQVVIALAYQGEMSRRCGNLKQALSFLQTAYHTPVSESAVHGNCAQLLGRVSAQQGEHAHALRLMEEAEQIALHDDALQKSLHGSYCLGAVYLDYAQYYRKLGHIHKALDLHAQARAALPETPYWTTVLLVIQGVLLVEGGNAEQGIPVVLKAVELVQTYGYSCLLDHFYALQRSLGKQALAFHRASIRLEEALHGVPSGCISFC